MSSEPNTLSERIVMEYIPPSDCDDPTCPTCVDEDEERDRLAAIIAKHLSQPAQPREIWGEAGRVLP